MNTKRYHGATLAAAVLAAVGLAACGERHTDIPDTASVNNPADIPGARGTVSPSAKVIGVMPGEATGDPPGTTAVSAPSEVSKPVEQNSMPLPGQPNDHSNLARKPSEDARTTEVLRSTEVAKTANGPPPADERK